MTQALPTTPTRPWGRRVVAFVVPFVAAPFVTTGLFRLDVPLLAAYLLSALVVPAVLFLVPRPDSRWLAAGWFTGCIAFAMFLLWLFSVIGSGMAEFGS